MTRRPMFGAERLARTVGQMIPGTLGGRSRIASPVHRASNVGAALGSTAAGSSGSVPAAAAVAVAVDKLTTDGDVLTHDGTGYVRLPIGVDDTALMAAGGTLSWGDPAAVHEADSDPHPQYVMGSYVPLGNGDPDAPGYLFASDGSPIYVTAASAGLD